MELLYLYIPESAGYIFKDQQINFTGRHKFSFNKETRTLTYEEKKGAVDGSFFTTKKNENTVVSAISAIIGDNGAGKTTIADFLYQIRIRGGLEHIMVCKTENGFKISAFIIPELLNSNEHELLSKVLVTNRNYNPRRQDTGEHVIEAYEPVEENLFKLNRKSVYFDKLRQKLSNLDLTGECSGLVFPKIDKQAPPLAFVDSQPFTLVYSSNYYYHLHKIESINETIDISTSSLILKDKETFENGSVTDLHPIAAHSMMEMVRNAELFCKFKALPKKPDWKLPTPMGVSLSASNSDLVIFRNKYTESLKKIISSESSNKYVGIINVKPIDVQQILEDELKSDSPKFGSLFDNLLYKAIEPLSENQRIEDSYNYFIISLFKTFLANFFRYNSGNLSDMVSGDELSEVQKREGLEHEKIVIALRQLVSNGMSIDSIKNFCKTVSKLESIGTINRNDKRTSILTKFNDFAELIELFSKDNIMPGSYYIDLTDSVGLTHFENIINRYFTINTITHFISFTWAPSMSSGELAQFNIYSRLFAVLKDNITTNDIVIFFDEIEITIHPRLQRRLVSNLLEFFNLFFKETNFKVHLIFASHSPILLSDIPKDHTIELKRNGNITVVLPRETESFGANIHSLYEHYFRLGEGDESLIGQFAFEKIRELINKINSLGKDPKQPELDDIEREIAVIGEPFMKHKIQELLEEKIPHVNKQKYLQMRLKHLKDETAKIEQALDGGNDA